MPGIFARFGRPPVQLVRLVLDHNLRNTQQIHEAFGPLAPSRMYSRGGEGWNSGHVCLLTTGRRHPVQVERTDYHDQAGYWSTFFDEDDVFYDHVLGARDRSRERLYVGVSRATDELVVVGDPDVIRAKGGDDVARRLGIM